MRAAQSGKSAIIDATGAVLRVADVGQALAFAGEVRILDGVTPYTRLGDAPWHVYFGALGAWTFFAGRHRLRAAGHGLDPARA